jgi:ubiquinone/menaquinone biosynthesis C-methylase UbiE
VVDLAADHGTHNLHLLWHFVRGKGSQEQFAGPAEILPVLLDAHAVAEARGMTIDNIETLKSQVFSSPGTRHDCSIAGWESLAIGPDGAVYPSPALVGIEALNCGSASAGLESVWRQSPVLQAIRQASLADSAAYQANPLKFLVGGGDLDHSYLAGGHFIGHDPYVELHTNLALWLIARQASQYPLHSGSELLLRMGDVRHDCPDGGKAVSLTHCNCVIALADDRGHRSVRDFYAQAALATKTDIVNPFAPTTADFIPLVAQQRSYGCGSPVQDAAPQAGETLVDLGSGSGVECFLAAEKVGPRGKVYGIDMTDEMLTLARASQQEVQARLGYDNLEFRQGYLEALPLDASCADVVISNCVINLSGDKDRVLKEAFRVLKPGGRFAVSDVVTRGEIRPEIRASVLAWVGCVAGALDEREFRDKLAAAGFEAIDIEPTRIYRAEDAKAFLAANGLDAAAVGAEVDGKFLSAFVRARKPAA